MRVQVLRKHKSASGCPHFAHTLRSTLKEEALVSTYSGVLTQMMSR